MHSVAQYLSAAGARRADRSCSAACSSPAGCWCWATSSRRDLSALADALALLRFGRQEGFFWAALRGLIRTFFSDYWRLRQSLGLARYDGAEIAAKLESAGFSVEPARSNIGHNNRRMTFLAHVR